MFLADVNRCGCQFQYTRYYILLCSVVVASFPGSSLAPPKIKSGGGEPDIDSHVISRHVDVTACKIREAIM